MEEGLRPLARAATPRPSTATTTICTKAVAMLGQMEGWVDEIPPEQQAMRFGNRAFKDWHARMLAELPAMLAELLPGPSLLQETRQPCKCR